MSDLRHLSEAAAAMLAPIDHRSHENSSWPSSECDDCMSIRKVRADRLRVALFDSTPSAPTLDAATIALMPETWPEEDIEVRRVMAADGKMLIVVGPFSGPLAASPTAPGLPSELAMADAIHEAFHWGLPTLTCMTKHRSKARLMIVRLSEVQSDDRS